MITVTTFNVLTGKVIISVPMRYRSLVAKYAQFGEGAPFAAHADGGWTSLTDFRTWIQLPGVVVES